MTGRCHRRPVAKPGARADQHRKGMDKTGALFPLPSAVPEAVHSHRTKDGPSGQRDSQTDAKRQGIVSELDNMPALFQEDSSEEIVSLVYLVLSPVYIYFPTRIIGIGQHQEAIRFQIGFDDDPVGGVERYLSPMQIRL